MIDGSGGNSQQSKSLLILNATDSANADLAKNFERLVGQVNNHFSSRIQFLNQLAEFVKSPSFKHR